MSPISSPSLDSLAGIAPPSSTPAAAPVAGSEGAAAAAVNWLLTWIGQVQPEVETAEAPAAMEPATKAQPMQWLTLLPVVPAFQPLFTDLEAAAPAIPAGATTQATPMDDTLLGELSTGTVDEELLEQEGSVVADTAQPMINVATVAVPPMLTPVVSNEIPSEHVPVEMQSAPVVATPQIVPTPGIDSTIEAPGYDSESHELPIRQNQQARIPDTGITAPPIAPTEKGEVIWTADLVVRDKPVETVVKPEITPTQGSIVGEPATPTAPERAVATEQNRAEIQVVTEKTGKDEEPTPNQIPAKRTADAGQQSHRERSEDQSAGSEPEDSQQQQRKTTNTTAAQRPQAKELDPVRSESLEPMEAREQRPMTESTTIPSPQAPPKMVASAREVAPAPALNGVDAESPRPLRPTQVATLLVDVPSSASADGGAPMRLAISQRGDQVNVRLRSWDSTSAPLESERMQPLMQSLAEQGLESASFAEDGIGDSARLLVEQVREKTIAAGETATSSNDQQASQNSDERQQKNHDRQQQAFFLRRQLRSMSTDSFDIQSLVDGVVNTQQQGAL